MQSFQTFLKLNFCSAVFLNFSSLNCYNVLILFITFAEKFVLEPILPTLLSRDFYEMQVYPD